MNSHPTRRIPVFLLSAMLFNLAWMGWLWWEGFPRPTSDIVCFKQPAYMRLHTPYFGVPTYGDHIPLTDKLNSYPTVIFYYVNYLAFRGFGFGLFTSLAVDLSIHLTLVTLAAACLWKLTESELAATLFLIASSQLLLPIGRPEELGILLALIGLIVLDRGKWGLPVAIVALGLTGVTTPGAAIVGTTLYIAYDGFRRGFHGRFWRRAAAIAFVAPLVSLTIYTWYAWPHLAEAWRQDRALRETSIYTTASFLEIVQTNLAWTLATFPVVFGALVAGLYCLIRKPSWYPQGTAAGAFVAASVVALSLGFLLNLIVERLHYDYRHLLALSLAALLTIVSWLPAREASASKMRIGVATAIVALCLIADIELFRYTLAPLAQDPQAMTYEEAARQARSIVPATASVGGDGSVWTVIQDGRPFISTRVATEDDWPDYLLSSTWARIPPMAQGAQSQKLESEYVEITPGPRLPLDGAAIYILGFRLPIATGRADWHIRVWKRKDKLEATSAASRRAPVLPAS